MHKLTLKEKEEIIRKEYTSENEQELAEKLGYRNVRTLRTVASRLGITKKYSIPYIEGEQWKPHKDFPNYLFSNKGRIKSINRDRLIKQRVHEGYYDARLVNNEGLNKSPRTHRIVAELFVEGKKDDTYIVNHKDANKLNNDSENLEWCTYRHNAQHALANIDYSYDAGNRLEKAEVITICELLQEGLSIREVMQVNPRFTRARVEKIRQRKTHKEISKNFKWIVY